MQPQTGEDEEDAPMQDVEPERQIVSVRDLKSSTLVDWLLDLSTEGGVDAALLGLVAGGADLDQRRADVRSELSLCLAAGRGDIAAVEASLRCGVEVSCSPIFTGLTPLMFAVRFGQLQVLEVLLQQPGILMHGTTSDGQTALSLCGDSSMCRLVAHGILGRTGDSGRYSLLQAACLGHLEVIGTLLDIQVDPNHCDEHGRSALLISALRQHLVVCELLLARGADASLADFSGKDVQSTCVRYGQDAERTDTRRLERLLCGNLDQKH